MKTELEWFKPEDRLPDFERDLLLEFMCEDSKRSFDKGWRFNSEKYRVNFMDDDSNEYDIDNGFVCDGNNLRVVSWAYVNLPEENEVDKLASKFKCDRCKFVIKDCICEPLKDKEIRCFDPRTCNGHFPICMRCWEKNKEKEIFKLKKCESCNGRIDGGSLILCNKCLKKPEDSKPDFSKLKEGDLVVVNTENGRTIIGFFFNYHIIAEIKFLIISNLRETIISKEIGRIECSKIKKIIRINIDEPKKLIYPYVGLDSTGKALPMPTFDAYPFEEI